MKFFLKIFWTFNSKKNDYVKSYVSISSSCECKLAKFLFIHLFSYSPTCLFWSVSNCMYFLPTFSKFLYYFVLTFIFYILYGGRLGSLKILIM